MISRRDSHHLLVEEAEAMVAMVVATVEATEVMVVVMVMEDQDMRVRIKKISSSNNKEVKSEIFY